MKKAVVVALALIVGTVFSASAFAADAPAAAGPTFKPFMELDIYGGYKKNTSYSGADRTRFGNSASGLIDTSNVGFEFNAGKVTGKVALGFQDTRYYTDLQVGTDGPDSANNAYLARRVQVREAFIDYDFSVFTLHLGQDRAPSLQWSNEATWYNNSWGYGAMDMGYVAQAKISVKGFYLDIMQPQAKTGTKLVRGDDSANTKFAPTSSNTHSYMPMTAVGYDYKSDTFSAGIGGIVNYFTIVDKDLVSGATKSYVDGKKILSAVGYIHASVTIDKFSILTSGGFGQNAANVGYSSMNINGYVNQSLNDKSKLVNSYYGEGYLELGYKVMPTLALHIGAELSYLQTNLKKDSAVGVEGYTEKAQYRTGYYVNAYYEINSNLTIAPEVLYYNNNKNERGQKQGNTFYAGVLAIAKI